MEKFDASTDFTKLNQDQWVNTLEGVEKRRKLKSELIIRQEIRKFWLLLSGEKRQKQSVQRSDYMALSLRLQKYLLPEFDTHEAALAAQDEWKKDASVNASQLKFSELLDYLFEVADYWTQGVSLSEYVNFLRRLFYAITKPITEIEVDIASLLIEDLAMDVDEEETTIDTELLFIYKNYRWRELDQIIPWDHDVDYHKPTKPKKVIKEEPEEVPHPYEEVATSSETEVLAQSEPEELAPPQVERRPKTPEVEIVHIDHSQLPYIRYLSEIKKGTRPSNAVSTKLLLSTLPKVEVPQHAKPTVVFVLGKPGVGNSAVSEKISEMLGCPHFDFPVVLQKLLEKKVKHQGLWEYIFEGNVFDEVIIMDILDQLVHTEEVAFHGFVLSGFPFNSYQIAEVQNWLPLFHPNFVIHLDVYDNNDLISRFAGAGVDYLTGKVYDAKKIHKFLHKDEQVHPVVEKQDNGEEDEEEEEEEEKSPEHHEEEIDQNPLDEDIYERLVDDPEYDKQNVVNRIQLYENGFGKLEAEILGLLANTSHNLHINATQPISSIVEQLHVVLKSAHKVVPPQKYTLPAVVSADSGTPFQCMQCSLPDATFIQSALTDQSSDGIFLRLSEWGIHCPVTYAQTHELVKGNLNLSVIFQGKVYSLSTPEALNKFNKNPNKYITFLAPHPPIPTPIKVVVVGPPVAGKTTHAVAISQYYGLTLFDIEAELNRHIEQNTKLGQQVASYLKEGGVVPLSVYADILREFAKQVSSVKNKPASSLIGGWIIDGFPRTKAEADVLFDCDLLPDFVIDVRDETEGEQLALRAKAVMAGDPNYPLPPFQIALDQYNEHHPNTLKTLLNHPKSTANLVDVSSNVPVQTALGKILSAVDPTRFKTTPVDANRAEFPPIIVSESDFENLKGGDHIWGLSKHYCPVSLVESNALVPGKEENSCSYKGLLYSLASDEEMALFTADPAYYIEKLEDIVIPPMKVWVYGGLGARRDAAVKYICQENKVESYTVRQLVSKFVRKENRVVTPQNPLSEDEVVAAIVDGIDTSKAFVLDFDNYATAAVVVPLLAHKALVPNIALNVHIPQELACKRIYKEPSIDSVKLEIHQNALEEQLSEDAIRAKYQQALDETIKAQIKELNDKIALEAKDLEGFHDSLTEQIIPVASIDDAKKESLVQYAIKHALQHYVERQESLIAFAVPIDKDDSETFISEQILTVSEWEYRCPVLTYNEPQTVQTVLTQDFPVYYKHHIYYMSSAEARKDFILNPVKFTKQGPKLVSLPLVLPNVFIVGTPKSGKTTLSKKLANTLGAVRLTMSKAIRLVLSTATSLKDQLHKYLNKGLPIPDEVLAKVLKHVTTMSECQRKGWILDGFPVTRKQAEALENAGLIPNKILWLEFPLVNALQRAATETKALKPSGSISSVSSIVELRFNKIKSEFLHLQRLFRDKFGCFHILDGFKNKWNLECSALEVIYKGLKAQHLYHYYSLQRLPAPVENLPISVDKLREGLKNGGFGDYCPVNIVDKGELCKCSWLEGQHTQFAVDYNGCYYKFEGSKELETFLLSPNSYVGKANLLPRVKPRALLVTEAKEIAPKLIESQGYCLVSFYKADLSPYRREYVGIVKGEPTIMAEYNVKYYVFTSEENRALFMRNPLKYINMKLPSKMPPPVTPVVIENLPLRGYMEQSVANLVADALNTLARQKPKYPNLDIKQSVLLYLSLFLKANNPKNNDFTKEKYSTRMTEFEDACQVASYLMYFVKCYHSTIVEYGEDFSEELKEKVVQYERTLNKNLKDWVR